ncbi:MAG: type IV secretion system DNA-binding domain-containing protein [Gammaproteobacteria bacterium]
MENFTRGGQVLLHQIRMFKQVLRVLILAFMFTLLLTTGLTLWRQVEDKPLVLSLLLGQVKAQWVTDKNTPIEFKDSTGRRFTLAANRFERHPYVIAHIQQLKTQAKRSSFIGLISALVLVFLLGLFFCTRVKRKTQLVDGNQVQSPKQVKRLMHRKGIKSSLTIGGCPLPDKKGENKNIILHGGTGTGKSQIFRQIAQQLRKQGKPAIVYAKGDLLDLYRPGKDILLNPLDTRGAHWSLFEECQTKADFEALAESLIPMPATLTDPYWINSPRTLFVALAMEIAKDKPSHHKLFSTLNSSDLSVLQKLLEDTPAASLVSKETPKTTYNIISTLSNHIRALENVDDQVDPNKAGSSLLVISEWVKRNDDGWLFLTSRQNQHALLKPLLSTFLNIAFYTLLSLEAHQSNGLWVMLDELPSLQRLSHLMPTLAEARKFGGHFLIGMQNYLQLRAIYGANEASVIASLCDTGVFFRSTGEVNEWVSKQLGQVTEKKESKSISYGASHHRDGVNLSTQEKSRPLVSASKIAELEDLEFFIRLKGKWPVVKTKIPYVASTSKVPAFISKEKQAEKKINPLDELFFSKQG